MVIFGTMFTSGNGVSTTVIACVGNRSPNFSRDCSPSLNETADSMNLKSYSALSNIQKCDVTDSDTEKTIKQKKFLSCALLCSFPFPSYLCSFPCLCSVPFLSCALLLYCALLCSFPMLCSVPFLCSSFLCSALFLSCALLLSFAFF